VKIKPTYRATESEGYRSTWGEKNIQEVLANLLNPDELNNKYTFYTKN
jgi:hypothetical protein